MGLTFSSTAAAGNAPNIEKGMHDARFDGVREDIIEQSKYDPECFIWEFTLLGEDGKVVYDEGEPVTVEKVTSRSTNTKSKTTPGAVKVLKALMTEAEFRAFENEEPVQADQLLKRGVQLVVDLKENGWPRVEEVLAPRRGQKGAKVGS